MIPNIGIVALAALIPLFIGFIYYNPNVLGKIWMKVSGMTEEKIKDSNMGLILGLSYFMSFILCFMLAMLVVHETDVYSLFANEPGWGEKGSPIMEEIAAFIAKAGNQFRSFEHGALHGGIVGVFIGLPIIMINGLFERKSLKYGFLHAGYWIITLALAGGVLCKWGF